MEKIIAFLGGVWTGFFLMGLYQHFPAPWIVTQAASGLPFMIFGLIYMVENF